jgi:hypothetical protein
VSLVYEADLNTNVTSVQADYELESTQLAQIRRAWMEAKVYKVALAPLITKAQNEGDSSNLLHNLTGHLIMLVENEDLDGSPFELYEKSKAAAVEVIPEINPDQNEDEIIDFILSSVSSSLNRSSEELAKEAEVVAPQVKPRSPILTPPIPTNRRSVEAPTKEEKTAFTYEDIRWLHTANYRSIKLERKNFIKILLGAGAVPTLIIHNNYAAQLPIDYELPTGSNVEYLPHWTDSFYLLDHLKLWLPNDAKRLNIDIEVAREGGRALAKYAIKNSLLAPEAEF